MRRFLPSVLLLAASAVTLPAQQEAATPATDSPYVLHVYQNLIQVPTLVLTQSLDIPPPVPMSKFKISIDSGPKFLPTHMHLEDDDAINLAILLDASGDQDELLKRFNGALGSVASSTLHHEDHISVFAYDCKLFRSQYDVPADVALNQTAVTRVLNAPKLHGDKPHHCKGVSLWDSVMQVTATIASLPGRRVILIVSDGHSQKGTYSFVDASEFADARSIAVFGMRDQQEYNVNQSVRRPGMPTSLSTASDEDLFDALCQKNGGVLTVVYARDLPAALKKFVAMLRSRYILEFPRPDDDLPGIHNIVVTIAGSDAYIRPTGVTVLPAPARDPNTLPPTPSPASYGKRRPLDPTH